MHINDMTKEDFNKVPVYDGTNADLNDFRSLVIIPTGDLHDSGFMCMEYCMVNQELEPLARVSGVSDVLHLDGIGGYGDWDPSKGAPKLIVPKGWNIDCLPCGYLRLFSRNGMFFNSKFFGSSVEVYAK